MDCVNVYILSTTAAFTADPKQKYGDSSRTKPIIKVLTHSENLFFHDNQTVKNILPCYISGHF